VYSRLDAISTIIPTGHADFVRDFSIPATDGELSYFANTAVVTCTNSSPFWTGVTYVAAWNLSTACEHTFTHGAPDCSHCVGCQECHPSFDGCNGVGNFFHSVIDRSFDPRTINDSTAVQKQHDKPDPTGCGTNYLAAPTGLAVQRSPGSLLFVAHGFLNQIRVFDKRTGASVCNVRGARAFPVALCCLSWSALACLIGHL
jgi:hypothetical protein